MNSFEEFTSKHLRGNPDTEIDFELLYRLYMAWCYVEDYRPVGKKRVREHLAEMELEPRVYFCSNVLGIPVVRNIQLLFGDFWDQKN